MLRYDDNKLVDFGEENNFDRFLQHDLPFSYVTSSGEVKKPIKGRFIVQYEGEEPEEYIIGENINSAAELVKTVINSNAGEVININNYNIKIVEKDIS